MDERPSWRETQWWIVANTAVDVFQYYRDTLNDAITSDEILRLANELFSKGIISRGNLDHAQLIGVLPTEKKVHLFDAIEARIRSHPEDFCTVLDILNREPVYRDIAKNIWNVYSAMVCAVIYVYTSNSLYNADLRLFRVALVAGLTREILQWT